MLLQEAFTKAAGKKSKTSVELDLGDMLAALEKQQQAMKARQLTNTKPLSFTGMLYICILKAVIKKQNKSRVLTCNLFPDNIFILE